MPATKKKPSPKASGNGHSPDMSGIQFDAALKASGEFQMLKVHVQQLDETMSAGFSRLEDRFDSLDANPMVKLGAGLRGVKRLALAVVGLLVLFGSAAYGIEHMHDAIKALGF